MTPATLKQYNSEALIPGPGESEEEFIKRAEYCLHIRKHLLDKTDSPFPKKKESDPTSSLNEVFKKTKELYDISPSWVPIIYDNHKLSCWHGGCAWIFQLEEEAPISAILQLRASLATNPNLLGLYKKEEIIAHEFSHIGRMAFEEPLFEEVFAYRSSPSSFRRWLGPITKSSIESGLFALSLFLLVMLDLFLILSGYSETYYEAMWLKFLPISMIGYGLFRLFRRHQTLKACVTKLKNCTHSDQKAWSIAYRLQDQEILSFSKMTQKEILSYINKENSLRWKAIKSCYFSDSSFSFCF